jgi:hypothetical protein
MRVLNSTTKDNVGLKAVGSALKNPGVTRVAARAAAPVGKAGLSFRKRLAKQRAQRRVQRAGKAARTVGNTLLVEAPEAAQRLGLIERPAPKRTAPRIAVGVLLGASAMYMLEPGVGRQHRERVLSLVS